MSASHTTEGSSATSRTDDVKQRRLTILPGVGLVDLDDAQLTGALAERLAGKVGDELMLFAARMREGLLAASVAVGLEAMSELMEAEVIEVAGPKGRHNRDRVAYRHGGEDGSVTLGGRRVSVRHPRVRTVDGREVPLDTYDTFASTDLLADHVVASMLAGLSTRRYRTALEPVGANVEEAASGVSRSAVSRRFVTATAERLAEFRSRPLDGER